MDELRSYRVDKEKATQLLLCTTPMRIVVNAAPYVPFDGFVDVFKKNGYSVSPAESRNCVRLWSSDSSVLIYGNIDSVEELSEKFPGVYTYAYLYPNSLKSYGNILTQARKDGRLILSGDDLVEMKKNPAGFVNKMMEKNRAIYNSHLEAYENRVLTVLV